MEKRILGNSDTYEKQSRAFYSVEFAETLAVSYKKFIKQFPLLRVNCLRATIFFVGALSIFLRYEVR